MQISNIRAMSALDDAHSWRTAEAGVAVFGTFLLGLQVGITHGLTIGDVFALGFAPIWLRMFRAFRGMRPVAVGCLAGIVGGLLLAVWSSSGHSVLRGPLATELFGLLGVVMSLGFLLWARSVLGIGPVVTFFGLAMLAAVRPDSPLFSTNPWRFGFSMPATVIVLGFALWARLRTLEMFIVAALVLVATVSDARSTFGIMTLVLVLIVWQRWPRLSTRRSSAIRIVFGVVGVAVALYQIGQAMILDSYLGEATRIRTVEQIQTAGSLLLGARPELAATLGLLHDRVWGYGFGVAPNYHDLGVAKQALSQINYDPNNGYVEQYMFGSGFELHSIAGDTWARTGFFGIAFLIICLVVAIVAVAKRLASREASALVLFLGAKTAWNLTFSPWTTSSVFLVLLLVTAAEPIIRQSHMPAGSVPDMAHSAIPSGGTRTTRSNAWT